MDNHDFGDPHFKNPAFVWHFSAPSVLEPLKWVAVESIELGMLKLPPKSDKVVPYKLAKLVLNQ